MSNNISDNESKLPRGSDRTGERLVYVLPEHALVGSADDGVSLRELWNILWRRKWWIIAVTIMFAIASVSYALLATEWYRAEALLAPAEEQAVPSLGGQLGGLAALAGVNVGGGNSVETVATFKSRDFARAFIAEFDLLPVFFADEWDADSGRWIEDDPEESPDIRDAVKYFHDDVLDISEDSQTGLVTLAIEWTDPEVAATWVDALVHRLNTRLRERSLKEAETNVAYLQAELAQTSVVTLQQSIGRLLESELQKLMLARGNDEFAFRVIDAASAPKDRVRPKRALVAILGTLLGGIFAILGVFLTHAFRANPESSTESNVSV